MTTSDWANNETVVFTRDAEYGLLLQRGDLLAAEIGEARAVASIGTLGDVRRLAASHPWAADWLEHREPDMEDVFGTDDPADDTPVADSVQESYVESSLPVPWDASSRRWLPDTVLRLANVGGSSPGGHIDAIFFPDPDQTLDALRQAGYTLVEDDTTIRATVNFPDIDS